MSGGKRRLAGILAADVVGYSAMIAADEPTTLARVRALHTEIVEPAATTHDGRLFKTMGDGFLLEFASAVQALRCAIAIQTTLSAQANGLRLRIGVHQGEVVPEGDDLFGDGVIVAARLEPLADHGGIVISSRVKEDAAGKMALEVDDLGEPELKNIAARIRVYRVRLAAPACAPVQPALALPDKPSVAVLPFQNMSGDPEHEYFADGMADDIITELSRDRALFVIARNSSFIYKGHAVDVKQVARELSVRYVLEGSVRREATRVRVNAQLIDAETGNHLWAERYDRDLADIFAVQTEIAAAVMTAIAPAIADAELRRALRKPPESLGAWEAYQRGLWHLRRFNEADFEWAKKFFQQAIKLESMFAPAYLGIAQIYTWEGGVLFKRPIDEALKLARENIRRALEIDPDDALAQATLAIHMSSPGNYEAALEQAQQALKRNPNLMQAHQAKGMALLFGGRPAEGREALRECLRLSPRDQQRPLILCQVAMSYYFEGEYERAAGAAQHVVMVYPDHPWAYRWLAAALGQLGRVNEAHDALCTALTVSPNSFEQSVRNRNPWVRLVDYEHMLEGLRKAGWQG